MSTIFNKTKDVYLTQAQYDTRKAQGKLEAGITYKITDALDTTPIENSTNVITSGGVYSAVNAKQDILQSGINIKTINNTSIVGEGNIGLNTLPAIPQSSNYTYQLCCTNGDVYWQRMTPPVIGDKIVLSINGTNREFRVIKTANTVANKEQTNEISSKYIVELLGLFQVYLGQFSSSESNVYENSAIDNFLSNTWYGSLPDNIKNAIVPRSLKQDSWNTGNLGNPIYTGLAGANKYTVSLMSDSYQSEITRSVYTFSISDILTYLHTTPEMTEENTTLTSSALSTLFNPYNIYPIVTMSAQMHPKSTSTTQVMAIFNRETPYIGYCSSSVNTLTVVPVFQIDLSQIRWE